MEPETEPRRFSFFRWGTRAETGISDRPVLSFDSVSKFFDSDRPVLKNLSFDVARGEFVFITGASGAGKSTMLKMIHRQLRPDSGRVLFCGQEVQSLPEKSVPFLRRNIGIVFQDFRVIEHWTVFENVATALEIANLPQRVVRQRVSEVLERVGLAGRGAERVSNLSGGEKQRVAVARAIVPEPALVLADEPTGNLDPALAVDVLSLLEEVNDSGITVLFATHDHSLIERTDHRILSLENGRMVESKEGLSSWQGELDNIVRLERKVS